MAALAAGEQGKFWEMHDAIFVHQSTIRRNDLLRFASQLDLDVERFQKDLDDPALKAKIDADKEEGIRLEVTGTPTFVINGEMEEGFSAARFQQIMARKMAGGLPQIPTALPSALPDFDLSFGPKEAPIKVEWYADLDSPLTARSAIELQQFVSAHPGAVQVRFRNFPLPNRNASWLVHQFVLGAAAQGKFWAAEALLLADAKPKNKIELKVLASQLGLDQNRLWAEIDTRKYDPLISRDLVQAVKLGVTGTPTFVIGNRKLDGADGLRAFDKR
jgi:protein-disulfide isomerase